MANTNFSQLPVAIGLDGSEIVPIVQGGVDKRTTTAAIANTATGFVPDTARVNAGTGLTGGGLLTSDPTINLDVGEMANADMAVADSFAINDVSAGDVSRRSTFPSAMKALTGLTSLAIPDLTADYLIINHAADGLTYKINPSSLSLAAGNVPAGGTTGQFLSKVSNTNYDTTWSDPSILLDGLSVAGNPTTATALGVSVTGTANQVLRVASDGLSLGFGAINLASSAAVSGLLALANGGLNANLTASNGGLFYSTATGGAILSGTATANQIPLSGASGAPSWSTATYPGTAAQGTILNAGTANVLSATATPTLGIAGTTLGTLGLSGNTSGVVTISPAAAAGTWTLTLPTSGGTNNYVLTTNGSGVTTWTNPTSLGVDLDVGATAIVGGATTRILYDNAGVLGEYTITGSGTVVVMATGPTLASPIITTSPTAAGSTWTDLGSVTTVDINGGTIDGTVIGGSSAAAITGTTVTGNAFVPNSSSVPTNGMYLPAASTLGFAVNSTGEVQLTSTALSPITSDGNALGTTALMWADLFLASGGIINWNNGNVTITHSANALAFAGASSGYSFDALISGSVAGNALRVINTTDSASVQVARFEGDRATPANDDAAYISLMLSDAAGTQTEFVRLTWVATDATDTSEDGALDFGLVTAGSMVNHVRLNNTTFRPITNDSHALGAGTVAWSDLFLASGGVINWNNGNYTITHSAGLLTFSGGITATAGTVTLATVAGAIDMGGATSLEIPNSAAPTINTTGQIALDSTVTDFTGGALKYYSGAEYAVVAMPVAQLTAPANGAVPTYNSTTDTFDLAVFAGGGATTALDNLSAVAINTTLLPGSNDGAGLGSGTFSFSDLFLATGGVINWANGGVTITESTDALAFAGASAGYTFTHAVLPSANDGAALGSATVSWADLFLASGAVINFNNGNATITHSAALLTFNTAITLGTSNAFTCGTIELGAASDTTISRSAAGVIAVEGVPLYSNIPQNSQSAAYTTVLADAQCHILHPTADNNPCTFTIAANASVAYPIGTAITFVNQINTVTIAINGGDTLTLAALGTTGSRTLAANGIATALKIGSTSWIISGVGLT